MSSTGSFVLRGGLSPDKAADALLGTVRSIDPPSVEQVESMERKLIHWTGRFCSGSILIFRMALVAFVIPGVVRFIRSPTWGKPMPSAIEHFMAPEETIPLLMDPNGQDEAL